MKQDVKPTINFLFKEMENTRLPRKKKKSVKKLTMYGNYDLSELKRYRLTPIINLV